MEGLAVVLRKEARECVSNWKQLVFLAVAVVIPRLLSFNGQKYPAGIIIIMAMMGIAEYAGDSFSSDLKDKGLAFLFNLKTGFFGVWLSKALFGLLIGMAFIVVNFKWYQSYYQWVDLAWIVPAFLATMNMVLFVTGFIGGSGAVTFMFATVSAIVAVIVMMAALHMVFARVMAMLVFFSVSFAFDVLVWRSRRFRSFL